jgi:hypothetical protein
MPRGVNLSTSAEVRPRGFIFRSGEPAPEPSPRVRLGSCDERSTEALVEAGSAVVIGLWNAPLLITHATSPRARQRGASNRDRSDRDRAKGGAVWWYSPGRTSYSISRLGYPRPRSDATIRSMSATVSCGGSPSACASASARRADLQRGPDRREDAVPARAAINAPPPLSTPGCHLLRERPSDARGVPCVSWP